jgi:hypothetical protein
MNNPLPMRVVERIRDLPRNGERVSKWELSFAKKALAE